MSLLNEITKDNAWSVYVELNKLDGWGVHEVFNLVLVGVIQFSLYSAYVNLVETGRLLGLPKERKIKELTELEKYKALGVSALAVWSTYPLYGLAVSFNVITVLFS